MKSLHIYMNHILECRGASIDAFYYCPIIRSMESAHIRRGVQLPQAGYRYSLRGRTAV